MVAAPTAATTDLPQSVLNATFVGLNKGVVKRKYTGKAARIMAGKPYRKKPFRRTYSRSFARPYRRSYYGRPRS